MMMEMGSLEAATMAEIDLFAIDDNGATLSGEQMGIITGESHGEGTVGVDGTHDFTLHLPGEDHANDLHSLRGRHSQATSEFAFHPESIEH